MAIVTNTFQTYQAIGRREDLSNTIYNISPSDTPFMYWYSYLVLIIRCGLKSPELLPVHTCVDTQPLAPPRI